MHLPLDVWVEAGDELFFRGSVAQPSKAPNPGVFCYRTYLRRLGVFGVSYSPSLKSSRGQREACWTVYGLFSARISRPRCVTPAGLGPSSWASGTNWGQSAGKLGGCLAFPICWPFLGMHVGYLALGITLLVQRLPWRPWLKYICVQAFLLAYILISGTGASAWRALLVSTLGGYASLRGLRRDALHLWAAAGWILLLTRPSLAFDLGFMLSFAASGGILLWAPVLRFRWRNRVLTYIAQGLLFSTAAQLSLAPFLLNSFGEVALLGPVATLFFYPALPFCSWEGCSQRWVWAFQVWAGCSTPL